MAHVSSYKLPQLQLRQCVSILKAQLLSIILGANGSQPPMPTSTPFEAMKRITVLYLRSAVIYAGPFIGRQTPAGWPRAVLLQAVCALGALFSARSADLLDKSPIPHKAWKMCTNIRNVFVHPGRFNEKAYIYTQHGNLDFPGLRKELLYMYKVLKRKVMMTASAQQQIPSFQNLEKLESLLKSSTGPGSGSNVKMKMYFNMILEFIHKLPDTTAEVSDSERADREAFLDKVRIPPIRAVLATQEYNTAVKNRPVLAVIISATTLFLVELESFFKANHLVLHKCFRKLRNKLVHLGTTLLENKTRPFVATLFAKLSGRSLKTIKIVLGLVDKHNNGCSDVLDSLLAAWNEAKMQEEFSEKQKLHVCNSLERAMQEATKSDLVSFAWRGELGRVDKILKSKQKSIIDQNTRDSKGNNIAGILFCVVYKELKQNGGQRLKSEHAFLSTMTLCLR